MTDVGVIAVVPDKWHGIWMPRHQVLSRLARHFEVVWVEPASSWRRYWLGERTEEKRVQSVSAEIPGFNLYDPGRWKPEVYRPRRLGDRLRKSRIAAAARMLRRKGCSRIVLYLWRHDFAWALDAVEADLVCYHIDDEYQFSPVEKPNDPDEVALIRKADLVVIHSPKLMEKKGQINPHTVFVPNGVDFRAYSTETAVPDDLKAIPRPRMGYVGVIKTQLDIELLLHLARRRPNWSFVLVGPKGYLGEKAEIAENLEKLPNVHFLGNRQIPELPAYTQNMDVCMMCYEVNDYTNYIYPLKLHEYLATGRPVVSSPINSVLSFGEVVHLARTPEEWEAAMQESLSPDAVTPAAVEARKAVAFNYDWNLLVERIAQTFRGRLANRSGGREG